MAQKRITKSYDQEFKSQAVKLAQEIGGHKAAAELGIPSGSIIVVYSYLPRFRYITSFRYGIRCKQCIKHCPHATIRIYLTILHFLGRDNCRA